MKFEPKRGVIYGVIIFVLSVPLLILGFSYVFFIDSGWFETIIVSTISFITGFWLLWAWFGTYYVITEDYLIIKHGPFKKKIDLYAIQKIEKNHMPIASVALSTKRYNMQYGRFDTAIIAPKNIKALVNQIERHTNKKIELHD